MKNRVDAINKVIAENNYTTYLEIGFQYGISFNGVKCRDKAAVDPNPLAEGCTFKMTSDEFFDKALKVANEKQYEKPDVIFIDGDHSFEQSLKDFDNSLKILDKGGAIIFHDTNPPTEAHATPQPTLGEWCGEVYKTIVELRKRGYYLYTYPFDFGVTVVYPHKNNQLEIPTFDEDVDYKLFNENRNTILNIVA